MKKRVGRLLAILLCFMICMSGTGFYTNNVYATTTDNTLNDQEDTEAEEKLTLQEIKKNAVTEIKDYATVMKLKVSKDVAKQINEIVKKYTEAIGEAEGNKSKSGLKTEAGVMDCVTEAKAAIDALLGTGENGGDDNTTEDQPLPSSTSDFVMVGGNWVTPTATYGQLVNVVLPVVNMSGVNLANVTVTPVTSNLVSEWPFEIETSGYTQTITDLPGKGNGQSDMDRRRELTWTFKTRQDALSGYYKLQFNVLYYVGTEVETATLTTYVLVRGAAGSGNVEAEGGTSTPRVIVTGYETNPKEVHAGDTFTLTLHLKNTSQRTAVSNMLVNLTAPTEGTDADTSYAAFLPTSGSNTEYITTIGKGATVDLSIEMTAKADLLQKPYQIDVNMEYEDEDYTSYSSTADVSIPILQEARFELSTPEILPASITVGNEANVMFSIYNTGKITLYNVKVHFEDDTVKGGEVFLGKIEAGSTGAVDALVTGEAASVDDDIVKIVITYEDEAGKASTYEQEINLTVTEDVAIGPEDYLDEGMVEGDYEAESSPVGKIVIAIVILFVVVLIVVIVVVVRKKKQKKEDLERINLLDELEGEDDSDEIS
nr:hypothetical protein [Lachnospiraceae bacterium]